MDYEKEANVIVREIGGHENCIEAWVSDVGPGHADICIEYGQRTLPAGMLRYIGRRADLRVEGTDGEKVELLVQL